MSILAAAVLPHPPIILSEVGHGEEKKIDKTVVAYREVMRRIAKLEPETIIILSPHAVMYGDYFHISPGCSAKGDLGAFHADDVKIEIKYDSEFVEVLSQISQQENVPAGTLGKQDELLDHGTLIPFYFLNEVYSTYQTVRIGLSGLSPLMHCRLGQCIAKAAESLGRRVVLIASGDLSHKLKKGGPYGFAPEGPKFDKQITDALAAGDFLSILCIASDFSDAAAECGLRSFQVMAGALDKKAVTHELLSYEGPFGVGYGVAIFEVIGQDANRDFGVEYEHKERERLAARKIREDDYVRLARRSVETFVKTGKHTTLPDGLPYKMLNTRAGTFVSLKKHGQLRGCIGTTSATKNSVAEEIMQNAVSSAQQDPRFDPVTEDELSELVYSVDVLGEQESIDSPDDLDVKRYGVIVQNGSRRGLLLPNLEGVNSVDEQIAISKRKAGIRPEESVKLMRFEVVRHQ